MKKFLFFMILSIGLVFASCKKETPDPGYFAGIAAKGYYDLLLEGKYNDFVAGYNQPNRIPKGYHEQLLLNAQMFMEQQQEEHKGLAGILVLHAKADTARHVADVFLQMVYGDSTKEQVVVPMVQVHGDWKMR
nr:hypothetical protein [uncultured Prevotella sp.]